MEKKSKFKKFLTTASALAVIAGASTSALGDLVTTSGGGAVVLENGQVLVNALRAGNAGNFVANDDLKVDHGVAITLGDANAVATVGNVEITVLGSSFIVNAVGSSVGNITLSGNGAVAALTIKDGKSLILNGADNTGLGNIILGDAGAGGAKLTVDASTTIASKINGDAAGKGVLEINAGRNVTFNGAIGDANSLALVETKGTATFNAAVSAVAFNVTGANARANVNAAITGDVTVNNGGSIIGSNAADVTGNVVIDTNAQVNGAAVVNTLNDVTGNVTLTNGSLTINNVVGAHDVTVAAGTLIMNNAGQDLLVNGGNATVHNVGRNTVFGANATNSTVNVTAGGVLTGAVTTGVVTGGNLVFLKNGTATAAIGANGNALTSVTISDAVALNANVFANEVRINTANGKASVAANGGITGNVTTDGNNTGQLIFAAVGGVTGNIGAKDHALNTVELTGLGNVTLTKGANAANGQYYAETFLFKDNAAKIIVADAGSALHGAVKANAAGDGQIQFGASGSIDGVIGENGKAFGKVLANGANTIVSISAGDHYVGELNIDNVATAGFKFADGANINGAITTAGANGGVVTFDGAGSVTGKIADGNALTTLNIDGGKDKLVAFSEAVNATELKINNGGTVQVKDAAGKLIVGANGITLTKNGGTIKISSDIDQNIAKITTVGSAGSIIIDKTVGAGGARTINLAGQIGDHATANALDLLDVSAGANGVTVDFNGANNSHITAININSANVILDFTKAAGVYKIEGINADEGKFGTLKISEDTKFESANPTKTAAEVIANPNLATFFGSDAKRLKALEFKGDKTLTLGSNIGIYADTLTNNATEGTITFEGNGVLNIANENVNTINALNINGGANTLVALQSALKVQNDVTVNDGATLVISKNLTTDVANAGADHGLIGKAAGKGTVRFDNSEAITITGRVGSAANSLAELIFAGKDVTFAQGANNVMGQQNSKFTFGGAEAMKVTFNDQSDIGNGNKFVNTTKDVTHTLILTKAGVTEFKGSELASADNGANRLNFQLGDGINVKLSGATKADGARFITGADNKGQLEVAGAGAITLTSIGATGKNLELVTFANNGAVKESTYSKEIKVAAGKTASFNLSGAEEIVLQSENLGLQGAGAKVVIGDNTRVNAKITTTVADEGLVEFVRSALLSSEIGANGQAVKSIDFSDDEDFGVLINSSNLFAKNVNFNKGHIALGSNLTITGSNVKATNANIILQSQTLNIAAGNTLTFDGTNNVAFDANIDEDGDLTGGKIVIAAGANLEYNAGTKIILTPLDAHAKLKIGGTQEYILLDNSKSVAPLAANKMISLENIILNEGENLLSLWDKTIDTKGTVKLIVKDNTQNVVNEILAKNNSSVSQDTVAKFINATEGSDAYRFLDMVREELATSEEKIVESFERLTNPVTGAPDAITATAANVNTSVAARMQTLAGGPAEVAAQRVTSSVETSGVAAGDDAHRYGVWASPFYNNTTQKKRKGAAGYKSEGFGASVGFDTRANDDMIVGAAITGAHSELKHKNFKSGDKTKINSFMFSIYGMQQITDNWFVHAVATYGTNEVKNTEKRVIGLTTYDLVKGNYTAQSFNGEAVFGYNYVLEQASVTPMFGLRATRVNDGGYKESGSTGQNLTINSKATNKLEVIAGARVSATAFDLNGITLNPEIHGFVNHDLIGKNGKTSVTIDGISSGLTPKTIKPSKTTYNLGLSLNSEYNGMEYGIGYDAELANKRIGHQGTLKVRVNF